MESVQMFLRIFIIFLVAAVEVSNSSGTFEWTLLKFVNPGGKRSDGKACDWYNQCDHKFRFGLDRLDGNSDVQNTPLLTKQSGVFDNQNTNTFTSGAMNNDVYNPIIYQFQSWQGGLLLKVYVIDDDNGIFGYDDVDWLMYRLVVKPSAGLLSSVPVSTVMTTRTSLYLNYRVYCDANFYGANCTTYCLGHDDNIEGHYSCDAAGNKVCLNGWENESNNCKDRQNDCIGNDCQNGALCIDGIRSYTCQCKPGFTGKYCQSNINECLSQPCKNGGTCIDGVNDYTCICNPAYVGKNCSQTACVVLSPCKNGGTCYGSGRCLCPPTFLGDTCEIPLCNKTGCLNGGKCSVDGSCMCPAGVIGSMCDVVLCNIVAGYCLNGGICKNGNCICPDGFAGLTCSENLACRYTKCLNNGQCKPTINNSSNTYEPKCFCPVGFSGDFCENIPQLQAVKYNSSLSSVPPQVDYENNERYSPLEILFIFFVILVIILLIVCIILSVLLCRYRKGKSPKMTRQRIISSVSSNYSASSEVFSDFDKSDLDENFSNSVRSIPKEANTVTLAALPNIYESDNNDDKYEETGYFNKIFEDPTYSRLNENEIGAVKFSKDDADGLEMSKEV